jgi:ABC-2 type transport system permease protein
MGILGAIGIVLIGTVAFAGLGMLLAGTLRAEATLALANGLFLVFLFLGGMAYPLEKLPAFLRDLAQALPAANLSECLHGVLSHRVGQEFPTGSLLMLCVWAGVLPAMASQLFRWEE